MHDERTERAWSDATAALSRGDSATFARLSREVALAAAAAGDRHAARALAALRERVLHDPTTSRDPSASLAAVLDALARVGDDPAVPAAAAPLLWRLARALVDELPADHPLPAAATELGWDAPTMTVMLAALAGGSATDVDLLALLAARPTEEIAPNVTALLADGALVDLGDGLLAAAPILAAGCAGVPSPHALAPLASRFSAEAFLTSTFDRDGIFVAEGAPPDVAVATLRAAAIPAIEVAAGLLDDVRALGWRARDARWRRTPLLLALDAPPSPAVLALVASVPRVIVTVPSPADAAPIGAALAAANRTVHGWTPVELAPSHAAEVLARRFAVPPQQVHVGHLHAADVDELARTITATGEDALWALRDQLARRAIAELSPFVFGAAPELPPGVIDRARELLSTDGAWGGRASALIAPLLVSAPIALALAADRGVVAATLALGSTDAATRMERAFSAARRWGAVLCVGIDRATPATLTAFARRLSSSGVTVVVGLRPGTPVPPSLAPLVATLAI